MTDRKYKLTISILASNRKDTLPKTLESIKPILENVSSELIVTDTGCDEELLQIIKEYTDNIVQFQWCNDFAKARNVGLKLAQGEWFMYIDDDEWFEDVTELVEFFNSEEEKEYNSFSYLVRNYKNISGTEWKDSLVSRGTRLDGEVEFVDIIHEHFSKSLKPIKLFTAYAHHYGYVFSSKESQKQHSERNLAMLEKQLADGDKTMRDYVHILQEYGGLGMYDKMHKVALEGIENAIIHKEDNKRFMGVLEACVVYSLMTLKRYEEACDLAKQYLCRGGISMTSACALNGYMSMMYSENVLEHKDDLLERVKEYISLRQYIEKNKQQMMYEALVTIPVAYDEKTVETFTHVALKCAVDNKDSESVEYITSVYKYIDKLYSVDEGAWLTDMIEMMRCSDNKQSYVRAIAIHMDDMICATKICNVLMDIKEQSEEVFMDMVGYIVTEDRDNPHYKLLKTIYYGLKGEVDKLK